MGGSVAIAVRKDGVVRTGVGYKAICKFAGSFSLQSGDKTAIDELFSRGEGRDIVDIAGGPEGLVPNDYGIVCVDIDAKVVDTLQGYASIGSVGWDVLEDLAKWVDGGGPAPERYSDEGMYVEAYMGGALHKCGESGEFEALSTKAATTFDAAKELVKKFGHMGRENLYRQFRMNAPGWKVIDWRATTPREVGLEEMARSLAGRGWPLPKETLEAWREYASDFDRDSDGAEPFAAWIESLAVKAELEAHGAVLQGKGGQSTKSRI